MHPVPSLLQASLLKTPAWKRVMDREVGGSEGSMQIWHRSACALCVCSVCKTTDGSAQQPLAVNTACSCVCQVV